MKSLLNILLAIIITMAATAVNAQDQQTQLVQQPVKIGLKGIFGLTTTFPELGHESSKIATAGGVELVRGVSRTFSVETGLYFKERGSEVDILVEGALPNTHFIDELESTYYFLSVPLMLRTHLGRLYVAVGPQLDIFLDGYSKLEEQNMVTPIDEDPNTEIKNLAFAVRVVAGYEIPLSDKLDLAFEAIADPQLTFIDQDSNYRFGNLGASIGMSYTIRSR